MKDIFGTLIGVIVWVGFVIWDAILDFISAAIHVGLFLFVVKMVTDVEFDFIPTTLAATLLYLAVIYLVRHFLLKIRSESL